MTTTDCCEATTTEVVKAFGTRTNNAELMRDCAQLGYLGDLKDDLVLDMTYGKGRFWKLVRPQVLISNDIDPTSEAMFHWDFTDLTWALDNTFHTVVFDPPYKLNGTGGSHPSDAGYGVANRGTVVGRMGLVIDGLNEAHRVCRPEGYVLVKCQDQVVSGKKFWQTDVISLEAEVAFNMNKVDMLHVQSYRAQPAGTRQVHSRSDYSTLLVFQKGKK